MALCANLLNSANVVAFMNQPIEIAYFKTQEINGAYKWVRFLNLITGNPESCFAPVSISTLLWSF